MPTPVSGQSISLLDIKTEFGGGENPLGINEYYQDAVPSYTSGVTGIPYKGAASPPYALISLGMFHGKSRPSWPAAVESSRANLGAPWAFSTNTNAEWLTGASGTNLTRPGGSTFNNIGAYGQGRTPGINNQSLILQAKPGDALRFVINNGTIGAYPEVNSLLLHLGAGWFVVSSIKLTGSHTDTINWTLSASLAPGSYGIFAYNNYSKANNPQFSSGNFYSLHVVS